MKKTNLNAWLKTGEYLPEFIRDFHDQKDLFKTIHFMYGEDKKSKDMPSWVKCHIYVIDWFLWYMASRGYTLQKCRKKVEFREHVIFKAPSTLLKRVEK